MDSTARATSKMDARRVHLRRFAPEIREHGYGANVHVLYQRLELPMDHERPRVQAHTRESPSIHERTRNKIFRSAPLIFEHLHGCEHSQTDAALRADGDA